ncbi:MAG: hypothetical protein IT385_18820 [Deltaproteobacteria bacterium]|nr:hypothetical protein [Deltaproteobacteria bacterium]
MSALALTSSTSCDALEESIQGQAAPLKEPDLPNCSRIINCCSNLNRRVTIPQTIKDGCTSIATPTDTLIIEYQESREVIRTNGSTSAQTKAQLEAELRENTQATLEPACRCLLEQTVGNLSLDGLLAPADCETIPTSGQLPTGTTCDDATQIITSSP